MYKQIKKGLALLLAAAVVLAWLPLTAQAAAEPTFKKMYTVFYENRANQGVYDIVVKNIQKGSILKWIISGKGKIYASFDAPKTVAETKTAQNRLTINSHEDPAYAAGEKIRITVKIYTPKKELTSKLTFAARLQSKAKSIDIDTSDIDTSNIDTSDIPNLNHLTAGRSYQFHALMEPLNTTSQIYWQVQDDAGVDHSSEITQDGLWTPVAEGNYKITALAKNTPAGQPLCMKSVQAVVGSFIESVTQTALNGIHVTFNSEIASRYKETDFTIRSGETSVLVKKVEFLEDGKTAYITTAVNFADNRTYTVSCPGSSKEFTASAGKPAALSITTHTAQAGKFTPIKYVLLDANGIDVTDIAAKEGTVSYSANINNGYLDQQSKRLYMTTVGNIGSVTLVYTSADGSIQLKDDKTILCVEPTAEEPAESRFTLTESEQEPSYMEEDVRTIAVGDTKYAHFLGLDEDDSAITYDSVTFESSDPEKLIISRTGKVTPIKTGSVNIVVTARQADDAITCVYPVTISEKRFLAGIQLKEKAVTVSNTYLPEYQRKIPVTAKDQYGKDFMLAGETGDVTGNGGQKVLASYDAAEDCIIVRAQGASAGTYSFTLKVTSEGSTTSADFTVQVSAADEKGAVTYQVESSDDTVDLSVDEHTAGNRVIRLRLCEYRGGVFYNYKPFTRASVRKGSIYYTNDMVTYSTGSAITLPGSSELTLTPLTIIPGTESGSAGTCRKAEPGIYTVTLTYMDSAYQAKSVNYNITVTDGQNPPQYAIRSLAASAPVSNALQLVNECISVQNGVITSCTAAGTKLEGSAIILESSEQLHIDTITVRSEITIATGTRVYVTHEVTVDRTLKNGS